MITPLFRSKAGVVVMTLIIVGLFVTLSKLRARNAARELPTSGAQLSSAISGLGSGNHALERVSDAARRKSARLRSDQEHLTKTSYDDAGAPFVRRRVPAPILLAPADTETRRGQADAVEPRVAPSLRISGKRKCVPQEKAGGPLDQALDTLSPKLPPFPALPSMPGFSASGPGAHEAARPERFVPFGRLIKAELVMTLESSAEEMPLVGLITEPVYNNGRLVIPAGTEIHSTARPNQLRDRIVSGAQWRMVFPREGRKPNGRQLTFNGIALDREDQDANGLTWPLTDGSYGLKGRVLRSGQTREEVLIFAAEALKAAGATLMDREATVAGSRLEANAKNAALAGGQAVLSRVAQGLLAELERNGAYVQVPAGKQFYIYPRQAIDPDRADIPRSIATVE